MLVVEIVFLRQPRCVRVSRASLRPLSDDSQGAFLEYYRGTGIEYDEKATVLLNGQSKGKTRPSKSLVLSVVLSAGIIGRPNVKGSNFYWSFPKSVLNSPQ